MPPPPPQAATAPSTLPTSARLVSLLLLEWAVFFVSPQVQAKNINLSDTKHVFLQSIYYYLSKYFTVSLIMLPKAGTHWRLGVIQVRHTRRCLD